MDDLKDHERFIQITATAVNDRVILYALDGNGRVWRLVGGTDEWTGMSETRKE